MRVTAVLNILVFLELLNTTLIVTIKYKTNFTKIYVTIMIRFNLKIILFLYFNFNITRITLTFIKHNIISGNSVL